ncbi:MULTISPECIES: hypothetical protein [Thiorhodovibrio]|uniref:hypothetical protein n=1 Tax=Thiorhodovibrio TaxID=61593 RepID=UPI00191402C5|nr:MULTISPECIES: hypothetical protein [Thiorhodovibrio]MBK5969460.1 hypothetical protein [Thiorhodovibrio winogradskyi]WPL11920.1 hypothetical protein Thiosp_01673 [Thiorhodovibrio litoralis]
MIATAGLSLEQAPPIDLPLRFFLTAPLFAIASALLLFDQTEAILATRWSPAALAATHLLTVGFLGQVMAGALLQMLPVVAGAPVPAVRPLGTAVHGLLTLGAVCLALGFLYHQSLALGLGALSAALGFGLLALSALVALGRKRVERSEKRVTRHQSLLDLRSLLTRLHSLLVPGQPFVWPLLALLMTVVLGLVLTLAVLGWLPLPQRLTWVDWHARWGLIGWVGLLILTVSLAVVPLFYVAPAYPRRLVRWGVPALFVLLCLAGPWARPPLIEGALAGSFALFALFTLWRLSQRARPRPDATLWHWWMALATLLIAVLAWWLKAPTSWTGLWLLAGVGIGLPSGMLVKILPFLSWFHLQSRQISLGRLDIRVPHMHRLLPERLARMQAGGQFAALALLLGAGLTLSVAPAVAVFLTRMAAVLLALAQFGLLGLLGQAVWRYRQVAR